MPDLAQLTDAYQPETIDGLPVEQPFAKQDAITIRPVNEPSLSVGNKLDDILNRLTGSNGKERYQLWPEKVIREGLSAAGDVFKEGTLNPGLRREDFTDIPKPDMPTDNSTWLGKLLKLAPVGATPADKLIERAQAISALAGSGGLAGTTDATLGATPFLRPALKYKERLYKGKEGQQHQDIIPKELYPEFEQMAINGEDISHYNFGFMNHKGQFLNREKALEYAINEGLLSPHDANYGALTSTMTNHPVAIRDPYAYTDAQNAAIKKYMDSGKNLSEAEKLVFGSDAYTTMAKGTNNFIPAIKDNTTNKIYSGDKYSNHPSLKYQDNKFLKNTIEGFIDIDGKFLTRKEFDNIYGMNESSQLTTQLLADSSKPGMAIEAMAKEKGYKLVPVEGDPFQ